MTRAIKSIEAILLIISVWLLLCLLQI